MQGGCSARRGDRHWEIMKGVHNFSLVVPPDTPPTPPPFTVQHFARMSEVEHGPFAMDSLRPQPSFTALSGVEARGERAEEVKEDGASLHDVKQALKNNFRATGVIDDVTVREKKRARSRTWPHCLCGTVLRCVYTMSRGCLLEETRCNQDFCPIFQNLTRHRQGSIPRLS